MGGVDHGGDARLEQAAAIERRDPVRAVALAEEVLAATRDRKDPASLKLQALALVQRGRSQFFKRDLEPAMETAAQACTAAAASHDVDVLVRARTLLGHLFVALGHDEAAIDVLGETIAEGRDRGAGDRALATCTMTLGSALRRRELFAEALVRYREAEALARASGEPIALASTLVNLASAAWQVGKVEEATVALAESRALYEKQDRKDMLAWQDAIESWVELAAGNPDQAIVRARAALTNLESLEVEAKVSASRALAHALASGPGREGLQSARELLERLAEEARSRGWTGDLPIIARELASVCGRLGDTAAGMKWLEAAFDARRAAEEERRSRRLTAEGFRLRVVRAEIEVEQSRLRAQALEAKNRELEALGRERSKLLSTVAHDLRSPLTSILLSLEHHQQSRGDEDVERLFEAIRQSAEHMTQVVDVALSTEAIRTGRAPIRRSQVDVTELVRRCLDGLEPLAKRKRIGLSITAPAPVAASTDDRALARIVENLLSNALKFTPADHRVEVKVTAGAGAARIEVCDEGPGFATGETEALFELGRRGAATPTSGEPSHGVGLHVVQDLVRALGGEIELGNRTPGPGAIVVVALPLGAA